MKRGSVPQRQARRVHRWLVPIAAAPLLLTAISGSMYSVLLEQGIDAFWLLKIHTGRFGWLNLESFYPCLLYTSPSPRDVNRSRMPSSA